MLYETNKSKVNLAKGGIAPCLYSPGDSSSLQLQVAKWPVDLSKGLNS